MIHRDDYDPEIGKDPHRDQPRKPSRREVTLRLDNLAMVFAAGLEELSALRHELRVEERLEPLRRKVDPREGRL